MFNQMKDIALIKPGEVMYDCSGYQIMRASAHY